MRIEEAKECEIYEANEDYRKLLQESQDNSQIMTTDNDYNPEITQKTQLNYDKI